MPRGDGRLPRGGDRRRWLISGLMKKNFAQEAIRRRIRRELWGCDEVLDLNENVHLVSEYIDAIVAQAGLLDGIEEESLRSAWKDLVGDYIAKCSDPVSLKRGLLTIRVTQPAMRFHLEQMRGSLLAKVQRSLGKDKIQTIRFSMG